MAGYELEDSGLSSAIKIVDGIMCGSVVLSISPFLRMVMLEDCLDLLVGGRDTWLLHSAALLG